MASPYLEATSDFGFKRLFGDKNRPGRTISFLNSVLGHTAKQKNLITKIVFNNTENLPLLDGSKKSILDINCTDQNGKEYTVEMQRKNEGDFFQRVQFYTSYAITRQLPNGGIYKDLKPVIFVGVTSEFNLFPGDPRYLRHIGMSDLETGKRIKLKDGGYALDHVQAHFIELKKFKKTLADVKKSVVDQWIYLLKNASSLEVVPDQFEATREIVEALEVLELAKLSDYERRVYIADREEELRPMKIAQTAREEAREESAKEIAREMLAEGDDINKIARVTKLSVEEIEKLK